MQGAAHQQLIQRRRFSQNDELSTTRGRPANFTWQSVGNVVQVNGRNYEITDCDLYGAFNIISSQYVNK